MKKTLLSIITITAFSFGANAQWNQIGANINGGLAEQFGGAVATNNDGTIIAVGAKEVDIPFGPNNVGYVRIFENIGNTWTEIGNGIAGELAGDYSGTSVSISNDGSIVAIGAPGNDGNGTNSGQVRVYENVSGTWTQIGADIDGETSSNESGTSVSLSNDGSIIAIGAPINTNMNGTSAGQVRVYENLNGTWTQIGTDIDGEATNDKSGQSVSINGDGTIVAIGAKYNETSSGSPNKGHVRIYQNISGTWTQMGSDINGEAMNDESGHAVSISDDGMTVAIGAPGNDGGGGGSGQVRVYNYITAGNSWSKIGNDIDGEATTNYFGISVSLSADGSRVAAGATGNSDNGTNAGHVRVYENVSGTWTQLGVDIDGETAGDLAAYVSLSGNGTTATVGAPYKNSGSGHVKVYSSNPVGINETANNDRIINIYPNPVKNQLTIENGELKIESINIIGITGKTVKSAIQTNNTIDVSDLTKGIYFLQVQTEKKIFNSKFIKE